MNKPKILVTGATGEDRRRRRFTTSRTGLAGAGRRALAGPIEANAWHALGAEIVQADLSDYDAMRTANAWDVARLLLSAVASAHDAERGDLRARGP